MRETAPSILVLLLVTLAAAWLPGSLAAAEPSYRLPWEPGKRHRCTQSNNGKTSHSGRNRYAFDFGFAKGTKISAARAGRVVKAVDDETKNGKNGKYKSSGNHVKIDHGDGTTSVYLHLNPGGALVEVGDYVSQGDVIALSGNTGHSTGPHLHFQVNRGGRSIAIRFADVESDGGIPASGTSYVSGNTPGIPALLKDRLTALRRAEKTASAEGALFLAREACLRITKIKLKVAYPPQDEARARLQEIDAAPGRLAEAVRAGRAERFEAVSRRLVLAQPGMRGLAGTKALRLLAAELREDPRFVAIETELKLACKLRKRFYQGLRHELLGKPASARGHLRYVARRAAGTDLGERAAARLAKLEAARKARRP